MTTTKYASQQAHGASGGDRPVNAVLIGRENNISRKILKALATYHLRPRNPVIRERLVEARKTRETAANVAEFTGGMTVYVLNMFGERGEPMPSKKVRDDWLAELRSVRALDPGSACVVAADMEPALLEDICAEGAGHVEFMSSPEVLNAELVRARVGAAVARAQHAAWASSPRKLGQRAMAPVPAVDVLAARERVANALGQLPAAEARRQPLLELLDIRVPHLRAASGRLDAKLIAEALDVPLTRLAVPAAVSRQALSQMPDSPAAQAGLDPVARVLGVLGEVLEPAEVLQWLNAPHKQLDGKPPLELVTNGEAEHVALMLERARDGGVD